MAKTPDEHSLTAIFKQHRQWADVKKICVKLAENGYTAWLAGGCVRDGLLQVIPKDFDIATNARPKKIEGLFNKTVDVGKAFGVIRVVEPMGDVEVATFRKDGTYLDGRRPLTVELSTPEEDAKRRDFTVNALFYDIEKDEIKDFVGGSKDLEKKIIRTVGIAADRFMEDKLRVLRAIRFVSQLDFDLDPLTYAAVCRHAPAITQVSVERISDEMAKLLRGRRPDRGMNLLHQAGLLHIIIPEIEYDTKLEIFFKAIAGEKDQELLGWLGILKMISDATLHEKTCKKLRFSNEKTSSLIDAIEIVTSFQIFDRLTLADKKKRAAQKEAPLALRFLELTENASPALRELSLFMAQNPNLPPKLVEASDLIAIGVAPGKELGSLLDAVFEAQLEGKVTNRGEALQWVNNRLKIRV